MSELLSYINPNEYVICNKVTCACFKYLGVEKVPTHNYQYTGSNYKRLCDIGKQIKEEMINENIDNVNLLIVDYMFWDIVYPISKYEKLETFYVKIRIVYDKTFNKLEKKKLALRDNIYKATMYESDKNYAHKDDDYKVTEVESLNYLIEILKQQLVHCRKMCNKSLPDTITLDFIPYDHDLFRIVNGITPRKEEMLEKNIFYE